MRCLLPAIFVFVSLAFSSSEISAQSLTTTSSSNNGSNGNMFDVSNNGTSSITITGFSQNFYDQSPVASFEVYTRSGGLTTSSSGWSLRNSTGSFTPEVRDTLTQLSFTSPVSITINAGETTGLYLRSDANNAYTNGTSVGAIAATNSNLTIYEGYGVSLLFGNFFSPRIWNGTIFYQLIQLIQITEIKVASNTVQLRKLLTLTFSKLTFLYAKIMHGFQA